MMTLNSHHNPLRVGTVIPIQQMRKGSETLSVLLKVTQLAKDQISKPWLFFFFLAKHGWGLQDLSSPTNDRLQPLQ